MSLNKVILMGRLGRDVELKFTQSGNAIANMTIATDESYTSQDGNRVQKTEWHKVVIFGKQAENCERYLGKGSLVFIEGKLQTRKWQDQQGMDKYVTEIVASNVQFLDRKEQEDGYRDKGDRPERNGRQKSRYSPQDMDEEHF